MSNDSAHPCAYHYRVTPPHYWCEVCQAFRKPMNDSTTKPLRWTDLPATAQVDAALRRAAAGVCGWVVKGDGSEWDSYWSDGQMVMAVPFFKPDKKRDDLARVFVAGNEMRKKARYESMTKLHGQAIWWASSLLPLHTLAQSDPKAALIGLLQLLDWPLEAQ